MTKIVIDKPPCPIPVLARPARKWRKREEWASQTEEAPPAPPVAESLDIGAKLRRLLMGDA